MTTVTPLPGSVASSPNLKVEPYGKAQRDYTEINPNSAVEPGESEWAEANLAHCPIIVRREYNQGKYPRARIWQSEDGRWWRKGGFIRLRKHDDGEYRFTICLRRGANRDDYRFLMDVVHRARLGAFLRHGWCRAADYLGAPCWTYSYSRLYLAAGDASRLGELKDGSPELLVCRDNRCQLDVHDAAFGDTHLADEESGSDWEIRVERYTDSEGEDAEYKVSVHIDTELTSTMLASFINDLQWAHAVCKITNDTPLDPSKKGIRAPSHARS